MGRWPARAGAAAALSVTVLLVVGLTLRRGELVAALVSVAVAVALAALVFEDSSKRGRSGWGWLIACVFLAPVAVPAVLIVAVLDRRRGRRGIEVGWDPAERWYLLAGLGAAVTAAALAFSPVRVPGESVSIPGGGASFSGTCTTALAVSLGGGPYGHLAPDLSSGPPAVAAAQATVADRCSSAAARRVGASALCLGAALLITTAGARMARRRGPHPNGTRTRAALKG